MTKRLVKYLSICSSAVVLPLAVAGLALTFTNAVPCTVAVEETGKISQFGATSDVAIYVNGELQEDTTVVGKHTQVKLVYTGEGYNFKGWYKGVAGESYAEEDLIAETTIEITATEDVKYTAVRDVIEYSVELQDENGGSIGNTTLEYNQPIDLSTVEGFNVDGWTYSIDNGESWNVAVTNAMFDASSVIIKEGATQTPDTPSDPKEVEFSIRLHAKSTEMVEGTLSEENGFDVVIPTREGYTLKGVKSNGVLYVFDEVLGDCVNENDANDKLSTQILNGTAGAMVGVWECEYDGLIISISTVAETSNGAYYNAKDAASNGVNIQYNNPLATSTSEQEITVFNDEDGLDFAESAIDFVLGDTTQVYNKDGQKVAFTSVVEIAVDNNLVYTYMKANGDYSFENLIAGCLIEKKGYTLEELQGKEIEIRFYFDLI